MLFQRSSSLTASYLPRNMRVEGSMDVTTVNPVSDTLDQGSVIESWIPSDPVGLNRMLRLIFLRDPVAGPLTDMMAELPWSDFGFSGLKDQKAARLYEDGVANLRLESFMPLVSKEYLAMGRFCASLLFDAATGGWIDAFVNDLDGLRVTPVPMHSAPPKIDFKPSQGMREWTASKDPRDRDLLDAVPPDLLAKIRKGGDYVPLDPEVTPYVWRRGSASDGVGTSWYSRIIPAVALEKQLLSGTAVGMKRRLGGILKIEVGSDAWEPDLGEMNDLAQMFQNADADPVGGIVVVRSGVQTERMDSNQSMWKLSDEADFLNNWKMRGLGFSEALMGGEARIESAETARTAWVDRLQQFRADLTRRFIVMGLLLPIAKAHDIRKRTTAELSHRVRASNRTLVTAANSTDIAQYNLPDVHWSKSLEPTRDIQWLDLLQQFEDHGGFVPLSMWAKAIGVNVRNIELEAEADKDLRERFKKMRKDAGIGGGDEGGGGGGGEDGGEFTAASVRAAAGATGRPQYHSIEELPIWDSQGTCMGYPLPIVESDVRTVLAASGGNNVEHHARARLPERRAELALYALDRLQQASVSKLNPAVAVRLAGLVERRAKNSKVAAWERARLLSQIDTRFDDRRVESAETTVGEAADVLKSNGVSTATLRAAAAQDDVVKAELSGHRA